MHIYKVIQNIENIPRNVKKILIIIIDISLCILTTWLAFYLRLEYFLSNNLPILNASFISFCVAIPIFWLFGLYRNIISYSGFSMIFVIFLSVIVYSLFYFIIISIYKIQNVPRSIGIIQPILLFCTILAYRLLARYIFYYDNLTSKNNISNKKNVLIYGAGNAGRQLLLSLEVNKEYKVVGYIDDDNNLHNQILLGKVIYSPSKLEQIIKKKNVSTILLSIPSISRWRKNQIIKNLNSFKVRVKTLPSISEIMGDKVSISDLRDFEIDDLLNRDQVKANTELLEKNIKLKSVAVSGAGGSIGSELCREIIKLTPNKLILLEQNEYALYRVYNDLLKINSELKIIPLLVNIQDEKKLDNIFLTFKVNTVYHSAAYKHVTLVEENICEGIKNNVFGSLSIVNSVVKNKVSNFVMISSDKAVRPTNIMGASKRLAEICVQAVYEKNQNYNTSFTIVRFGNVLESSGSVIPKFKKQIKEGGPVTLTHPEVTRYFMTIKEAAQLVIQASALCVGCEVFVLDMGKSIKIKDLIIKMIKLYGLSVKDKDNINGDIEIQTTGLRPGEKLYEELLIGNNPENTKHEKIFKSRDPYINYDTLIKELKNLSILIDENKTNEVKKILEKLLPSFKSNSDIVDHLFKYKNN